MLEYFPELHTLLSIILNEYILKFSIYNLYMMPNLSGPPKLYGNRHQAMMNPTSFTSPIRRKTNLYTDNIFFFISAS